MTQIPPFAREARPPNIGLTFKPGRALRGVGAILAPSHNADLLYVDSQES